MDRLKSPKTLLFLIVALALTARLLPGERTIDDSFITFRYARNLLAGNGFVYNPGESVLGTTTPLYTFLMAGLGALSGGASAPFPSLALYTNALADAITCLLLWQIGKHCGSSRVGLITALVWAIAPFSVTFAIGGLETSVYVLLLTAAMRNYLERRRTLTTLCAALALLTRPDAVLLIGPLALDRLYRAWKKGAGERLQAGEIIAFLAPTLAWYGFSTLYFGSPIPQSVQAKLVAYRLEPNEALIRLIQHYATPFLQQNLVGTVAAVGSGLVLFPFLFAIGAHRALKMEQKTLAFVIYPWLYLLAFAIPNPLIFRWYLTPPLPAYLLFILLGLESILKTSTRRLSLPVQKAVLIAVLIVLPFFSMASEWRWSPDHGPQRPAPEMAWIKLELLYRQAAEIVAPHMNAQSVLAAGDVGVLGFYTPGRILDTVGLNSLETSQYYPLDASQYTINYAIAPNLIIDKQPDFVILLEVYGRRGLLQDERFQQEYRLVQKLETDIYGSDGMLIFQRKN